MKSELRRSALERLWVLVHPEEKIPKGNACPFDEGNETLTPPEIIALRNYGNPNQSGWRVRVVPNHNPLFGVITPMIDVFSAI